MRECVRACVHACMRACMRVVLYLTKLSNIFLTKSKRSCKALAL